MNHKAYAHLLRYSEYKKIQALMDGIYSPLCNGYVKPMWLSLHRAKTENLVPFSHLFHPGSDKTNFFGGINRANFLFFCSNDFVHYPNQWAKSKGHLVKKNLSFVTPGIGFFFCQGNLKII